MKVMFLVIAFVLAYNGHSAAGSDAHMDIDYSTIWKNEKYESNSSSGIRLTLLHHQHPCSPFRHRADEGRDHQLSVSLFFRRRRALPTNITLPVNSTGKLYGFVAQIGLSTPSKMYSVLIDTGSSLSWIQCEPCIAGCYEQDDPLFNGSTSSTYRLLSCSSASCLSVSEATMSSTQLCSNRGICIYRTQYADLSASIGYLCTDTITTIGAESSQCPAVRLWLQPGTRRSFWTIRRYHWFGRSLTFPFVSQVTKGSAHPYRAFSYFLPSSSSIGYVQVGPYDEASLVFTPMYRINHLYYIELTDMMVGDIPLNLTDEEHVTARSLCNIDLEATFSVVPDRVHNKVCDMMAEQIQGYERVESIPWCFDPVYWPLRKSVPKVQMVFRDGARLELDETKLFSEQQDGRICLQLERGSEGNYMLGSMQLSMLYVVQDPEKPRMGFPETS